MPQAKLPESVEYAILKNLEENITVYVVPWAMVADSDGLLWLNTDVEYSMHPSGETAYMLVALEKDGFVCDISPCNYKWRRAKGKVQDSGGVSFAPVARLINRKEVKL